MTVVREERKDLLAEIAKRAGERRAQVQNILERYAKEKDQQPSSPGPALTLASTKTVSSSGSSGTATAACMAPVAAGSAVPAAPGGARPWAATSSSPAAALDKALERIEKSDRRGDELDRRLEDGIKRQAETERLVEQSIRRTDALAKLVEESARRAERLELRVAEIELRPEAKPAAPEEALLAAIGSRLADFDRQESQLGGLAAQIERLESGVREHSELLRSLEDRIQSLDRLTSERIESLERSLRDPAVQDHRFQDLEDAITRLANQIDEVSRTTEPVTRPEWSEWRPTRTAPVSRTEVNGRDDDRECATSPVTVAAIAQPRPEIVRAELERPVPEIRTAAAKPVVKERDQDKLKVVLDTLAKLTAELHDMSEQRRFVAGA